MVLQHSLLTMLRILRVLWHRRRLGTEYPMMPQANLFVAAPLRANSESELRDLLTSMNVRPGLVNARNPLVPFGDLNRLHFARFLILKDETLADIHTTYGLPRQNYSTMLGFIADFDGEVAEFRAELVERAGEGLRRIFAYCEDFVPGSDLAQWMKDHERPPATAYVNWVGRTVRRIREDNSLRLALEAHLERNSQLFAMMNPRRVHASLREFVASEIAAGQIKLTSEEPTPWNWRVRNILHLVGVPVFLIILAVPLLLYLPFFVFQLRAHETKDLEIVPRPENIHEQELAELEDNNVTNQFSAMGSVKPGRFRRWLLTFSLWLINYTARHFYVRGSLARVSTIHFARWVFLDGKNRLLFASNYDGSLDSYMDDFINKVGWGLNLVFCNGVGYPTTNWLILDGSKDEQKFKYFLRRHQLPTQVWYNAHAGLSALDLKKNALIREGIERQTMTDAELLQWLALF
jgi:hypothetical protein